MSTIAKLAASADFLALHALDPGRYPFLLESGGGAPGIGRFDILFAFPGQALTLGPGWQLEGGPDGLPSSDFLKALDQWWAAGSIVVPPAQSLPFGGGWFVFLAYELARQIEPRLRLDAEPHCPVATAIRIPAALIRDRRTGSVFACAEPGREDLVAEIQADVGRLESRQPASRNPERQLVATASIREELPEQFLGAVNAAKRYIAAGDVYQANISRRWRARVSPGVAGWMLYERLRRANPAPFSGLAVLDGITVISSSPERLLRLGNGRAETRPIAGTRPRRNPVDPDHAARLELVANPKERAEHVMLIDLERNDLGRVCRPGTVRVDEFMAVESYAHVHHIVSNVTGELRDGVGPGEALRAVFPGGTITGCPKIRCISIIQELEGRPRGAYTGAMGYLNHDGSGDFNILIRTMTLKGAELSLNAGSGIVADSVPERELEETRAKAKGMLLALQG